MNGTEKIHSLYTSVSIPVWIVSIVSIAASSHYFYSCAEFRN